MNVKKAKREKVHGPVKGFIMGGAFFAVFLGIGGFLSGSTVGGLVFLGIGIVIAVLGNLIPDKDRFTY